MAKADPSNRWAKDNLIFARVARYILLELFNRRAISKGPCALFVKTLRPPSREVGDTTCLVMSGPSTS